MPLILTCFGAGLLVCSTVAVLTHRCRYFVILQRLWSCSPHKSSISNNAEEGFKKPLVLHENTFSVPGLGPLECIVDPDLNDGLIPTTERTPYSTKKRKTVGGYQVPY